MDQFRGLITREKAEINFISNLGEFLLKVYNNTKWIDKHAEITNKYCHSTIFSYQFCKLRKLNLKKLVPKFDDN